MELVLSALQESRINFDFAISKLFTLNGKQIQSCEEIEHDCKYVAVERGSRFKPINYAAVPNFSPRTTMNPSQFTKLPPIATRINPSKISYSPRKPAPPLSQKLVQPKQNNSKRTEKKRNEKRDQKRPSNQPIPAQDSIVSPFEDQNLQRESFSHVSLSITPPPLDESPDFTLSEKVQKENAHLRETVKDSASPEVQIPSGLDKLPEKQKENIGLQLYNASGMQSEWGDMVVENKNTITDKLIDDVPAEEINDEEIAENIEDSAKITNSSEPAPDVGINENQNDENKPSRLELKHVENGREDAISATAKGLVESILKEEENEQSTTGREQKNNSDSNESVNNDDGFSQQDEAPSPEPSVISSQEDLNSEDDVQSSKGDEEEDNDDDGDDDDQDDDDQDDDDEAPDNEEDAEKSDVDDNSDKETDDEIQQGRETQSHKESEAEESSIKENRTNKKVEEQRADPAVAKKNPIKQDDAKRNRRGKRIDNKT